MIRLRLREKRIHNKSAFFAAIIVLVSALLTANSIGLVWSDITREGLISSSIFFGLFAIYVGFPAYFLLFYFAHVRK